MQVELLSAQHQLDEIEQRYLALETQASPHVFTSWGVLSVWLTSLPSLERVYLFCLREGETLLAACFICSSERQRWWRGRSWHINSCGLQEFDNPLWIEYNDLLVNPLLRSQQGAAGRVLESLLNALPGRWDELVLPGLDASGTLAKGITEYAGATLRVQQDALLPSHYIELGYLRDSGIEFLSTLSSNTRSQIRRAQKQYCQAGAIKIEPATSLAEAQQYFTQLWELHVESFRVRERSSEFATDVSLALHQNLINQRYDSGEIQLLKVSTDEQVIGYLYNFIYHKNVSFFQGGLSIPVNNKYKPGLVCHSLAIEFNLSQGMESYDFLAGNERYKSSLASSSRQVLWARLRQPRWYFQCERLLKEFWVLMRGRGIDVKTWLSRKKASLNGQKSGA